MSLEDYVFAAIFTTGAIAGLLVGPAWAGYELTGSWTGAIMGPLAFWGLIRAVVDVVDIREENERYDD